ncbi:MAG: hypothetical protein AAF921_18195 [Cyanobacteria bacterium P01_D01_bin.44]
MDDFYQPQEYQEILAETQANSLLEYERPGGEVGGTGLFMSLLLITVGVVWTLKTPQQ